MDFRNWLQLEEILKAAKQHVLSTLRVEEGFVRFSFPANYTQLVSRPVQQATAPQQQSMALAAGTIHSGEPVNEAREGGTKDVGAMKALQQVADPGWTGPQWKTFQNIVKKKTGDIGQAMGFLFEIEVLLYLMDKKGLFDKDEDADVRSRALFGNRRRKYMSQIEQILFDKAESKQIIYMVQSHAADLAEQIYMQSKRVLRCEPDSLRFTGGESAFVAERVDPADIVLFCKKSRLGWNIKFTSETKIHIMTATPQSAYRLLGGDDLEKFQADLNSAMQNATEYSYYTDLRLALIGAMEEVAKERFENNPVAFTDLLNRLISGKQKTIMAPRNWASPSMGGAQWSANIQKDFITRPTKLEARPDATVAVKSNNTYVKLTYKRPGGSHSGTSIFFEPRSERVIIKVNNLTSDRR